MKLTTDMLQKIIREEASKFGKPEETTDAAKDTKEVEADEIADSLEKKVDMLKALKIEEGRITKRLKKIQEAKQKLARSIIKAV